MEELLDLYYNQDKKCYLTGELLTYYRGPKLTNNNYESKYNIQIFKKDSKNGWDLDNIFLAGNVIKNRSKYLDFSELIHICGLISEKYKN